VEKQDPTAAVILAFIAQHKDRYIGNEETFGMLLQKLNDVALKTAEVMLGISNSEDVTVLRMVKEYDDWIESLRQTTKPTRGGSCDCFSCRERKYLIFWGR